MTTDPSTVALAPAARMRPRAAVALLALLLTLSALLGLVPGRAGAAPPPPAAIPSEPAANATVVDPPHEVTVDTGGPADPAGSTIVVYGSDGRTVRTGPVRRVAGSAGTLAAAIPPSLDRGVYTVVWRAAAGSGAPGGAAAGGGAPGRGSGAPASGAAPAQGSFAFAVDPDGASPALVVQERPRDSLNETGKAIPRFLAFAGIMLFIGALALRLLVTAPAARRATEDADEDEDQDPRAIVDPRRSLLAATDRRLLIVAGAAIALFVPATLGQLANESADPDAELGFWRSIRPGDMWSFVTDTPDGHLWGVRLLLTLLAAALLIPAALGALSSRWRHRPERVEKLVLIGLVAGIGELAFRVVPAEKPEEWVRDVFTAVLDFGHLLGSSVWVGGLVSLAIVAATLRVPAERRGRFWSIALRRFSLTATVCVGVMVLTGLWTAWIHLGPPRLLFHTLYGETLLVKLILVAILVACGALNQLWLLPRVNALRDGGAEGNAFSIALRHFRRVVAFEAVVGVLILLVVPFLSGSARRQEFLAKASDLTQTARAMVGGGAGGTGGAGGAAGTISLRPSGTLPGVTDYDVTAPAAGDDGQVAVSFASSKLGVPPTTVPAIALGGGRYRVTGLYTPIVGAWQVAVSTGGAQTAAFDLDVTAEPVDPGRPEPPVVRGSTWAWGAGETVVVLLVLLGGWFAGSRMTERRAWQEEEAREGSPLDPRNARALA